MTKGSDNEFPSLLFGELASAPTTPAAGKWRLYIKAGGLYIVDDAGAETGPFIESTGPGGATIDVSLANGRLTLETGVPVSVTDQTAKTTLYFTPYKGNLISLYDGSTAWETKTFSELSLDISGYTADKNYDIWAYNNSGTVALDSTIWTDDTTRATALTLQDGVLVKTGATTRRYLGTIRITTTTGQCEDSITKRYVWNFNNRVGRKLQKFEDSEHTYDGSGGMRFYNNDSTNKIEFVVGVSADDLIILAMGTTKDGAFSVVGIGINSSSTASAEAIKLATTQASMFLSHTLIPRVGYTYCALIQTCSGTSTFFGGLTKNRIEGVVLA